MVDNHKLLLLFYKKLVLKCQLNNVILINLDKLEKIITVLKNDKINNNNPKLILDVKLNQQLINKLINNIENSFNKKGLFLQE